MRLAIRAALREIWKRRSIWAVAGSFLILMLIVSWASYSEPLQRRQYLELARTSDQIRPDGSVCADGLCFHPGGEIEGVQPGVEWEDLGPAERQAIITKLRPGVVRAFEASVARGDQALSLRGAIHIRLRQLGTGFGVVFAILLSAMIFGADWRLGTWSTTLAVDRRRGRILAVKMIALLLTVLASLVAALVIVTIFDVLMRAVNGMPSGGEPSGAILAIDLAKTVLVVGVFAALAAACTTAFRSGIAGLALPLGIFVADGFVTSTVQNTPLRNFLPVQQVAGLIPLQPSSPVNGAVWWKPTPGGTRCLGEICIDGPLPLITPGRATLTLLAWMAIAAVVAFLFLSRRDIHARTL